MQTPQLFTLQVDGLYWQVQSFWFPVLGSLPKMVALNLFLFDGNMGFGEKEKEDQVKGLSGIDVHPGIINAGLMILCIARQFRTSMALPVTKAKIRILFSISLVA